MLKGNMNKTVQTEFATRTKSQLKITNVSVSTDYTAKCAMLFTRSCSIVCLRRLVLTYFINYIVNMYLFYTFHLNIN